MYPRSLVEVASFFLSNWKPPTAAEAIGKCPHPGHSLGPKPEEPRLSALASPECNTMQNPFVRATK